MSSLSRYAPQQWVLRSLRSPLVVSSISIAAWMSARASHALDCSSFQPARGAHACVLLHLPFQPPAAPKDSVSPCCWEATLGWRVFLTRLQEQLPPNFTPNPFSCYCLWFFLLYFWVFLLYPSPTIHPCFCGGVIVTQYICQITFTGDSDFVASLPRVKGLAFSKALFPRTFIRSLIFGLPTFYCVCIFYFLL
jgi:hypothetical protein